MTKDHKIRVLVSGLSGKVRQDEILRLLTNPEIINSRLRIRLLMFSQRAKCTSN